MIRTQTEKFLELFSWTLNFFAPLRCEDIISYYCFDHTWLFWLNAWFNKINYFALDACALLLLNYDTQTHIFPCILLTCDHMIFLVQFGINKHLLIYSKTTNIIALTLQAWEILLVFKKIYSCLLIPNCTRNHVITYTKS